MRGRLIQRFYCTLYRLDAVATAATVGGGYDDDFRTVRQVADGSQLGASSRVEKEAIRLPCQMARRSWGEDQPEPGGHEIKYDVQLRLHWPDLEAAGLIDAGGVAEIAQGDRIGAIETVAGVVEETFPNPPGLFVEYAERAGYGLAAFGTPRTNLLILYCRFAAKAERA
jgi:hypothetical protein